MSAYNYWQTWVISDEQKRRLSADFQFGIDVGNSSRLDGIYGLHHKNGLTDGITMKTLNSAYSFPRRPALLSHEKSHADLDGSPPIDDESNDSPDQSISPPLAQDEANEKQSLSAEFKVKVSADFKPRVNKRIPKDKSLNFILLIGGFFMSGEMRDTAIGDMEERFCRESKKFGNRQAKILLLSDIAKSIIPIIYAFALGIVIKALKYAGLYKFLRLLFEKLSGS